MERMESERVQLSERLTKLGGNMKALVSENDTYKRQYDELQEQYDLLEFQMLETSAIKDADEGGPYSWKVRQLV